MEIYMFYTENHKHQDSDSNVLLHLDMANLGLWIFICI